MRKLIVLGFAAAVLVFAGAYLAAFLFRILFAWRRRGAPPRCPSCGGADVRRSYPARGDRVYVVFSCVPYRCRFCERRFYGVEQGSEPANDVVGREGP